MLKLVSKLAKGLAKTKSNLVDGITRVVNQTSRIDEDVLEQIEEILILSDIGVETSEIIIDKIRSKSNELGSNTSESILDLVKQELISFFEQHSVSETPQNLKPQVISIVGVNGTGKTTSIGKLANIFQKKGNKVLLAAADTFRAAAIDQLDIWAERSQVDIVHNKPGSDPASVAYDALQASIARNIDILLIDTAGRLHTKTNLMAELEKIHRILKRQISDAPHQVLLVIDATTGQNGLLQAKKFAESVDVSGIILTKLDGTAKGGIIFSIVKELKIPVCYIGFGEKIDDLAEFDPEQFVEALFQ